MPRITLSDPSLKDSTLTPRVSHLRDVYFRAMPEICVERARLVTRFSLDNGFLEQPAISVLDKAKTYRYVLENRAPVVRHGRAHEKRAGLFTFRDDSLLAGSTTSKFKGVPLYPELLALALWPELWTISERTSNPFHVTQPEVEELNHEIFPHWITNSVMEHARKRCYDANLRRFGVKKHAPEMKLMEQLVFFLLGKPNCISHTIPNFSKAIDVGLRGVIAEARARMASASDDAEKEFYLAVSEVLEGVIAYSNNLAREAEELASREADPTAKGELLDIADINRRVPEFPARSFREALTTVWVCWIACHLENFNVGMSLGRLDQVLYELCRKDIDSGTLTVDQAIELICCLWLKIGDHVPSIPEAAEQLFGGAGATQAITVGGIDKEGMDAVNDLTYVMLRATELMKLRDPNVSARFCPGVNSTRYLRRLCEVNVDTGCMPALHNDRAIISALTAKGLTLEQARDYGVIGCVEPSSNGRAYDNTSAILLNLTSVLELTLFNGRHRHTGRDVLISRETGAPTTFETFDAFRTAFEEQTRWLVDQATALNDIFGRAHQDFYPTPILSALFEGPIEKGRDLSQGGAVINSSGVAIIGLADVADSLSAIEEVVFEEGTVSFAELMNAAEQNFKNHEPLQKRLMNEDKTPKYGNEDAMADGNAAWIVEMLDKVFGEKTNYRGGGYRVGYWTVTNHAGFGRLMEALPSGRSAYENLSSGITPVSGVTPYLTKTLNSVASLPSRCISNGMAFNVKYAPEPTDREKTLDNFTASVGAYFDDGDGQGTGGMEIQFNVATRDTLADAVRQPEKYPELLVRVSGYTAYFKDLNPQMQKEIIDRTEYALSSGEAVPFEPFSLTDTAT